MSDNKIKLTTWQRGLLQHLANGPVRTDRFTKTEWHEIRAMMDTGMLVSAIGTLVSITEQGRAALSAAEQPDPPSIVAKQINLTADERNWMLAIDAGRTMTYHGKTHGDMLRSLLDRGLLRYDDAGRFHVTPDGKAALNPPKPDPTIATTTQCKLCGGTVINGECQSCGTDGKEHLNIIRKRLSDWHTSDFDTANANYDPMQRMMDVAWLCDLMVDRDTSIATLCAERDTLARENEMNSHAIEVVHAEWAQGCNEREWLRAELDATNAELARVQAECAALRAERDGKA